jgi:hypothetical protein
VNVRPPSKTSPRSRVIGRPGWISSSADAPSASASCACRAATSTCSARHSLAGASIAMMRQVRRGSCSVTRSGERTSAAIPPSSAPRFD